MILVVVVRHLLRQVLPFLHNQLMSRLPSRLFLSTQPSDEATPTTTTTTPSWKIGESYCDDEGACITFTTNPLSAAKYDNIGWGALPLVLESITSDTEICMFSVYFLVLVAGPVHSLKMVGNSWTFLGGDTRWWWCGCCVAAMWFVVFIFCHWFQ